MNTYEQATQEVRDAFAALCKGRIEAAVLAEREACAKVAERFEPSEKPVTSRTQVSPSEPEEKTNDQRSNAKH